MNEEESIFGTEPERLMRLMKSGLEADEAEVENEAGKTAPMGSLTEQPGMRIGRYKILRILGEGGMGVVYLAEQQGSIRRRVALKVIKPGMDSARVLARFEAERQALALLDHLNVANVYDAGTTETGRPYFVLEYVKGLPITEYCDHHKMTIEQRLQLFQQVCHAIHHAHQKGIIHRDIKPSNIIVSTQDDKAVPKIIDFGVAKAISQPLTERTVLTEESQLLGTPEYMSPEQADMAGEDIDTRSDIYSLGVLLYVLLTGVLPFDSDTLRTGGVEHIRQIIRETDPRTPSTRLTKLGEDAKAIAQNRCTDIQSLAKHLRKELEWIPLKAMRKDRTERYRSAAELADDIENYLQGAPLIAGPLSTVYKFKKFVRRNRALVSGIAAVMVVLVIGIIVSTILAIGQARARAKAEAVADYLQNDVLNPIGNLRNRQLRASDILEIATQNLEGKFEDYPLTEKSIRVTLGSIYLWGINDYKAAELHLERAHQILKEQSGAKGGRLMNALGAMYYAQGRYKEAESVYDKLIEALRLSGADDLYPFFPRYNLACVYSAQGRYEEAETLFVETKEIALLERRDDLVQEYDFDLAEVYRALGKDKKAEQLYVDGMSRNEEDSDMPDLRFMCGLALLRMAQERWGDANDLLVEATLTGRRQLGDDHPYTLRFINSLGVLRTKLKQYNDAERLFHEALEGRKLKLGEDHPDTLESKNDLGVLYKEQGSYDTAEPLLLEAIQGRRLKLGDTHPHTLESWKNLIDLYEAWNKPEKASEWRAKLQQPKAMDE
jgi:serine/threonine protein kinase/Flp pilus assembly protein TadD